VRKAEGELLRCSLLVQRLAPVEVRLLAIILHDHPPLQVEGELRIMEKLCRARLRAAPVC
jgi:hypothetical protein